jgi:hypothetical protein
MQPSCAKLSDLVRAQREARDEKAAAQHNFRYLRCNDDRRSITAQLTEDAYAEVRASLHDRAHAFPSDGETRYDQRLADALVDLCRGGRGVGGGADGADGADGVSEGSGESDDKKRGSRTRRRRSGHSNFFVVLHTDLSFLRGSSGRAEVEKLGLLSREAARRLSCGATVALALDDAFGHTMFEGRAKRFATEPQRREIQRRDRRCRFPGCGNNIFTDVHHIVHWIDQGLTDLPNLVTLCDHHHRRIHEGQWEMSGNANGILRFLGPSGRVMTSRPSPLWTRRKN